MQATWRLLSIAALFSAFVFSAIVTARAADRTLLNVSYDPTRELYAEFNAAFADHWRARTGDNVTVEQSHGGSAKQAQAVIDGLGADIVSLALDVDIDAVAKKSGLLGADWRDAFPNNSAPYASTIVFLVRAGNPKAIGDWPDLTREGVQVITANPKTSGGARWAYLAAWASAGPDEAAAIDFMRALYKNVPVLDTAARGATVTFALKELGDVLLTWENEAILVREEFGADRFDIVYPSRSIHAAPPVALVTANADAHGTTDLARAYIDYLYSSVGQTIVAANHFRPSAPAKVTDKALLDAFPKLEMTTIDDPLFGGWALAGPKHFGNGGIFDQIYAQ